MVIKAHEEEEIGFRTCTQCKEKMVTGFIIETLEIQYYCTNECMDKNLKGEEYNKMYQMDMAYWTDFSESD